MTNLEAAMQIIDTYTKYREYSKGNFSREKLEAIALALFALAKEEENQDDCVCGD